MANYLGANHPGRFENRHSPRPRKPPGRPHRALRANSRTPPSPSPLMCSIAGDLCSPEHLSLEANRTLTLQVPRVYRFCSLSLLPGFLLPPGSRRCCLRLSLSPATGATGRPAPPPLSRSPIAIEPPPPTAPVCLASSPLELGSPVLPRRQDRPIRASYPAPPTRHPRPHSAPVC